jgi:hypothetical protein
VARTTRGRRSSPGSAHSPAARPLDQTRRSARVAQVPISAKNSLSAAASKRGVALECMTGIRDPGLARSRYSCTTCSASSSQNRGSGRLGQPGSAARWNWPPLSAPISRTPSACNSGPTSTSTGPGARNHVAPQSNAPPAIASRSSATNEFHVVDPPAQPRPARVQLYLWPECHKVSMAKCSTRTSRRHERRETFDSVQH